MSLEEARAVLCSAEGRRRLAQLSEADVLYADCLAAQVAYLTERHASSNVEVGGACLTPPPLHTPSLQTHQTHNLLPFLPLKSLQQLPFLPPPLNPYISPSPLSPPPLPPSHPPSPSLQVGACLLGKADGLRMQGKYLQAEALYSGAAVVFRRSKNLEQVGGGRWGWVGGGG